MSKQPTVDDFMDDLLAVCRKYYGNNAKEGCLWFEDDTDNLFVTLALPPFIEYMLADKHRPSFDVPLSKQPDLKLIQTEEENEK